MLLEGQLFGIVMRVDSDTIPYVHGDLSNTIKNEGSVFKEITMTADLLKQMKLIAKTETHFIRQLHFPLVRRELRRLRRGFRAKPNALGEVLEPIAHERFAFI